ncbi:MULTISPECIES: NUDIX domain-containing protein [unclassified Nocardioides]|uniref:NUDIX domain-containing protein n=1 Tax=unclassified Nocardioides TaxID=2615069 RepID=UPI001E2A603E|nr:MULTISPECIES: NUDIX domain-containing protein [unclassified Nocardioides]MCD4525991.1 NUDIX domain-containing protein [Nocardioides sp. cx-173]MCD4534914.1 NUDIX domain-containing protein [Nocardioides sp. cx-169]UGB43687.1 NUDIX domain-containing protein [Nocardioides sp. cx-173]
MHRFSSIVLVDRRGRVLLQERDSRPRYDPDRWGYPGGAVEPGEDYEQAAYRELEEETGVRLAPGTLELVGEFHFWSEPCGETDEFCLYAAGTDLTEVACHEGRQMVFVDPAVALDLDLTASARHTLSDFLASAMYERVAP